MALSYAQVVAQSLNKVSEPEASVEKNVIHYRPRPSKEIRHGFSMNESMMKSKPGQGKPEVHHFNPVDVSMEKNYKKSHLSKGY